MLRPGIRRVPNALAIVSILKCLAEIQKMRGVAHGTVNLRSSRFFALMTCCLFLAGSVLFFRSPAGAVGEAPSALTNSAVCGSVPCLSWEENVNPQVAILCLHGLGLHKGNYEAFGKRMAKEGFITYAIDLRGFGSWQEAAGREKLDFNGCLADVRSTLASMHRAHPRLPILLLGESMGGAIALRATALYPDQVSGLISSVPSGERFKSGSQKLRVAVHAVTEGLHKPMSVGNIVTQATQKPELRSEWLGDPEARLMLTPLELIDFQHFMNENFQYAERIDRTPVLLIQGCQDRLVRPAGTWDLFDHLKTPDRTRVFSTHAEHLIFEEAQFSEDDINYVLSWIKKNISGRTSAAQDQLLGTSSVQSPDQATKKQSISTAAMPTTVTPAALTATVTSQATQDEPLAMEYWIELYRNGKLHRCNNKTDFRSGDAIRFHFVPYRDGYVYVLLAAGTSGNRRVLFPAADTRGDNFLKSGRDYILPTTEWLFFDNTPGTERVRLLFSRSPVDAQAYLNSTSSLIALVSSDKTGAKDLVPTRMELSWDDPAPVIMPEQIQHQLVSGSVVKVRQRDPQAILAVDIALEHR